MEPKLDSSKLQADHKEQSAPGVMFEMLRSFTTLARTLNLSKTVSILGTTRQTVRRHISYLEELRGGKLFELYDRQYELTESGQRSAHEAEAILARCQSWVAGHRDNVRGLARVIYNVGDGRPFYAQQHPIGKIWEAAPPLIRKGLQVWVESEAKLEHPAMEQLKPYMVAYRKHNDDWLCVSVGDQSSYATWLGWTWAKSAIGSGLQDDAMHTPADEFVLEAYESTCLSGNVRFDHVSTIIPRVTGGPGVPISYQRLLMGCYFPNGQPALVTLIARTQRVEIEGIDPEELLLSAPEDLMEYEL